MKGALTYLLVLFCSLAGVTRADRPRTCAVADPVQPPALTFTLETKDKAIQFFDPISIRVVLHNNSPSSISLDTNSLRLIPDKWRVVGSDGAWSGGDGYEVKAEGRESGRIDLPARESLRLLTVFENPTFEQLGPARIAFRLSSTDAATKQLLPSDAGELSFDVQPTKLMSAVWTARTQPERERVQPAFNEFLRFRAATEAAVEAEDDGGDFQKKLRNNHYAIKSLFYMAGYALPFLIDAAKDEDPFIREKSIAAYSHAARAIEQLDAYLDALEALGRRPQWASALRKKHNRDQADWRAFAIRALSDSEPAVRIAGVTVLTKTDWDQYGFDLLQTSIAPPKSDTEQPHDPQISSRETDAVKTLSKDPDAGVREAVQKYLTRVANKDVATDTVIDALTDPNPTVRKSALDAVLRSPEPPPLETIKRAFALANGETAIGLIALLLEQEDSTVAATLAQDYVRRSEKERLAIITAVAAHYDSDTLDLIKSGLNDESPDIQRAALLRLLAFPVTTATPILFGYLRSAPAEPRRLAEAVKTEIETRSCWPFLKRATSASESTFPSRNGIAPVTSPDGRRIAYVETGWGRPGGSGGFGRSNLLSISHVVRSDGTDDRIVSDMFLVGWMSDSKRVGTARDAYAAISDFDGNVIAEFGDLLNQPDQNPGANHWTEGNLRSQFGILMPHHKRLNGTEDFGFGEGGAFPPDGKWYGPVQDSKGVFFGGANGERRAIKISHALTRSGPAKWSPDGRYVQLDQQRRWLIIDMQTQTSTQITDVDENVFPGEWASRSGGNPWSSDGTALVFVRNGQIWASDVQGKGARQLTFDATLKASPRFSPDGRSIAYITWQPDNRRHYTRLGPTDLWVVDVASTLATRVTAAANTRINNFDWLDDHSLIFDRFEMQGTEIRLSPTSSLRVISLN